MIPLQIVLLVARHETKLVRLNSMFQNPRAHCLMYEADAARTSMLHGHG